MKKVLPDVCDIQYGYAFDSAKFSSDQGVPLIRIRDVVRGFSETYTTEECSEEYIVNNGDILIGMDGEFNIAQWHGGKAYLNQRVCRLIPKDEINPLYLFYFMPKALKTIEDKTPFVTVKHLSAKELNKIVVPVPTFREQKEISSSLQKLDELISLRKQQLSKLDELVKSRFIELFGERLEKETVKLSTLTEVITKGTTPTTLGFEFAESGVNFVKIECITEDGKFIVPKMLHISDECNQKLKRSILQEGDVLFSIAGAIGRTAIVTKEILPANTNQAVAIIRLQKDCGLNVKFLNQMLHSSLIEKQVNVKKAGVAQINLSLTDIGDFNIVVPPMEEQEQFAAFVEQTDKSKLAIQKSLDQLETLKKSLMQKYFG